MKTKYGFETTEERSRLMSRIRGTNTKPEIILRKALWARGYRYRKNVARLPGKPDIVLSRHKVAIFVDGEFWHGFRWEIKRSKIKRNSEYWIPKIEGNMARDRKNNRRLRKLGFAVIRIWEGEIKKDLAKCLARIDRKIQFRRVSGNEIAT